MSALGRLLRLRRDTRAVAIVEFAYAFPVMLALYLIGTQLMDVVAAYRKVTTTTRAVADVTSQFTSVAQADVDTVLAASQQIMAPYNYQNAQLRVSQVTVDANGNGSVVWSDAYPGHTGEYQQGATFPMPANLNRPGLTLVVAEVTYNYQSSTPNILNGMTLRDKIFMMPRATGQITAKGLPWQ